MVDLIGLWLPILLSAVFVFIVSSVIHMALPWHKNDYARVASEDKVMDALRPFAIPPGDYMMPRAASMKDMSSPEFIEKMKKGPVMILTVCPNGPVAMGKNLTQWFLYSAVVSFFAAYLASRTLSADATYLEVFRVIGTTTFIGYALALAQTSIWYARAWSTTIKSMIDGLIYALVTAGTFGWLWP